MPENHKTQKNKKWPQYLTALTSVLATFSAGIHYGWPTPSLPTLLSKTHPLNMTSDEGAYVITVASVGDIVGNIVSTILADVLGRKMTILLISVPQICSMLLLFVSSYSLTLLYFARFLGGVGEGAVLCVIAIYIGEISEPKIRGILISFFSIAWSSGCLFINIVGSYNTIETASLITLTFPVLFLVTFIFAPESPYYLLMTDKIGDSRAALRKLRWNDNVDEELAELFKDVKRQMSERGKYQDLFLIKSNRDAFFIMAAVTAITEFSGISSLTFYAQLFFMKATNVLPQNWAATLIVFLQLVFGVISSFIVDLMGRRSLLLLSISGCASSLILLSVYFLSADYTSLGIAHLDWIPLVGMILFVMFFNIGAGNVVNCLLGELFSTSIKTKASCSSAILYSVCVVAVTKIYQSLSDRVSLGVPLAVFAFAQLLGWLYCWRFVPETKGKTLEEIQQEIKGNRRVFQFRDPCQQPLLQKE